MRGSGRLLGVLVLLFLSLPVGARGSPVSARVVVKGEELSFALSPLKKGSDWYLPIRDPQFAALVARLGGKETWNGEELSLEHPLRAEPVLVTPGEALLLEDGEPYLAAATIGAALFSAAAIREEGTEAPPAIEFSPSLVRVEVERTPEGRRRILISASAEVQFATMTLEDPVRLILDVRGVVLSPDFKDPLFRDEVVSDIRAVQFEQNPDVVRVIVTLAPGAGYVAPRRENQRQILVVAVAGQRAPEGSVKRPSTVIPPLVPAPAVTEGKAPVRLLAISAKEAKGRTVITMQADGEVVFEWRRLKAPDNRIFFDFKNAVLATPAKEVSVDGETVARVRGGQFEKEPPVVRVVADLKGAYAVRVTTKDNFTVVLEVENREIDPEESAGRGSGVATAGARAVGRGKIVVLDPGHGGSDTGARNLRAGVQEKEITLDISLRLERLLQQDGFQVLLTRRADVDVLGYKGKEKEELQARVNVANHRNADLFVSVHINASYSRTPSGASIHWYKALDLPLARILHKHLAAKSPFLDRGISRNSFYVVRHTQMPAVLLELGFITNPRDEEHLVKEEIREQLADAIRDGIVEFVTGSL